MTSHRFDRAEIMRAARARVRKANRSRFPLRMLLSNALREEWAKAKAAAVIAELALRSVSAVETAIRVIEAKERLSGADVREIEALRFSAAA